MMLKAWQVLSPYKLVNIQIITVGKKPPNKHVMYT